MKEEARSSSSEHLHLNSAAPFLAIPPLHFFLWFPFPLLLQQGLTTFPSFHNRRTSYLIWPTATPHTSLLKPATLHCTLPPTHKISQGKLAVSSQADEFPWGENQTHTPRQPEGTHCPRHVPEASQTNSQLQSSVQACSPLNFLARFTAAGCVLFYQPPFLSIVYR